MALKQGLGEEPGKKDSLLSAASSAKLSQKAGGCPRACVLPNPSCCLPQAWSCSSQACQRESSGNICLFLDILDSSVYLDNPRTQSQRSTSHLDSSTSQARSWGAILDRQLSSKSCWQTTILALAFFSISNPYSLTLRTPPLPHQ